jgi:hypothetical protein
VGREGGMGGRMIKVAHIWLYNTIATDVGWSPDDHLKFALLKKEKKNPALVVFLLLIVTYINFSVMNATFNSEGKSGLLHQTVK